MWIRTKQADWDEASKVWVCVREGETCHGGAGAEGNTRMYRVFEHKDVTVEQLWLTRGGV